MDRVEPELRGDAPRDELQHLVDHIIRMLGRYKEEVRALGLAAGLERFAVIDVVRIADNGAALLLAKDMIEAAVGDDLGVDNVAQDVAGAHAGQLVDITHEHEAAAVGQGIQKALHEGDVDHGAFIQDHHIDLKRVGAVVFEALRRGIELE